MAEIGRRREWGSRDREGKYNRRGEVAEFWRKKPTLSHFLFMEVLLFEVTVSKIIPEYLKYINR